LIRSKQDQDGDFVAPASSLQPLGPVDQPRII
jgi:hypothetical protein